MRKLMVVLLVVMLSLVLIVGACTSPASSPVPKPTASPAATVPMPWEKWPVTQIAKEWGWPEFFVTNGIATFYSDAVAVAELVKKYSGMKTQVVQIGTGVAGVNALVKGDAYFNIVDGAVVNAAFLGVRDFAGQKPGPVVSLASGDYGTQHGIYVRPGSGIKTPYDLKGKRLAYPTTMPVFATETDAILKAYGMSRSDIKAVPYTVQAGLPDMLRQNLVDAFVFTVAPGTPIPVDLTTTGDAILLSIDPDKIDAVEAAADYFYPKMTVPAGSFKGQDKELLTLSQYNLMHVKADLPESLVYTVTRILWEHNDELRTMGSSVGKTFVTPKGAVAAKVMRTTFHAGAVRYYKEVGVWGAEQEQNQQKFEAMLKDALAAYQKK